MPISVAFLGLGAIGAPMAAHIARAGHALTIWNRTANRAAASAAAAAGARVATSAADAVHDVDVVITCLPESGDVAQLLSADDGAVMAAIRSGARFVDCTSGDPDTSRRIAGELASRNIAFIDAPVSGGVVGAEAGKLTVMVGGAGEALDRARPVLDAFAGKIVHCGETGHWIIAKQILLQLGAKDFADVDGPKAMLAAYPNGEALLKLIEQRQRMMKDTWLTTIGHKRPGMSKGLPIAEAKTKAEQLSSQIKKLAVNK